MDAIELVKLLTDAPLAILLLYLLIQEQRAHTDTRRARDADMARYMERFAALAERVVEAIDRLEQPHL